MAKIFINGLYYNPTHKKGMAIELWDNISTDGSFGNIIFEGSCNDKGEIISEIDNKWIGHTIVLTIREPSFKFQEIDLKVTELGVFHSINLELDRVYNGNSGIAQGSNWNSQQEYIEAQSNLQNEIRQYKIQNFGIKYVHYITLIISVVLGALLPIPWNIVVAIFFIIIIEILTPYTIGLKAFWKRKK